MPSLGWHNRSILTVFARAEPGRGSSQMSCLGERMNPFQSVRQCPLQSGSKTENCGITIRQIFSVQSKCVPPVPLILAFSNPGNTQNTEGIQLIQKAPKLPWSRTKPSCSSLCFSHQAGSAFLVLAQQVWCAKGTVTCCRFAVCTAGVSAGTLGDVMQHFRDELNSQKVICSGKKYSFNCELRDKECIMWTGRQFIAVGECMWGLCCGCKYRDIPAFRCHLCPFVWTSLLGV